jgi:hypothetical protein
MDTVFNFGGPLFHEAKVCFVDKRGALESVVWPFLPKVMLGDAAQLLVDQRDEGLQGLLITSSPSVQHGAYRLRRRFGHTLTLALGANEISGQQATAMMVVSQSRVQDKRTPALTA